MRIKPAVATINQKSELSLSLLLRYIFTQKAIAGPTIKEMVRNIEPASGPKTSLPPQKNLWKKKKKAEAESVKSRKLFIASECPITRQ